jgi:hypothetical protein
VVIYENGIVCFMLKGAENLPAHGHKTEKNITLALPVIKSAQCIFCSISRLSDFISFTGSDLPCMLHYHQSKHILIVPNFDIL